MADNKTLAQHVAKPTAPGAVTLEAWAQGFMVGALIVMAGKLATLLRSRCQLQW